MDMHNQWESNNEGVPIILSCFAFLLVIQWNTTSCAHYEEEVMENFHVSYAPLSDTILILQTK